MLVSRQSFTHEVHLVQYFLIVTFMNYSHYGCIMRTDAVRAPLFGPENPQ